MALAFVYGCGGSPEPPPKHPSRPQTEPTSREASAPAFLPAHALVEVPEGSFGPYVGRSGERGLLLYAQPTERGQRFVAMPLDAKGEKAGPAHDAGPAPDLPPRLVVRPLGDGFVAAFTYRLDLSNVVSTLAFSASGEPKGEAAVVAHRADHILYADVVSLEGGAVLVYGIQKGNVAELYAVPLDADGRPRGAATVLANDALAWQTVSLGETAALAIVAAGGKGSGTLGKVALVRFDREGQPIGERTVVGERPTAAPDIDATRLGEGRVLLAWTDEGRPDARTQFAVVNAAGQVEIEPRPLTPPRGDQALLGLVGALDGRSALVAWEELGQSTVGAELPALARSVRLGVVGLDGMLRPRTATLAFGGLEGAPELAASPAGWVALTAAPACARQGACSDAAPLVPTVVHFDRDLAVLGSEPLATEELGPAALAWGLACAPSGSCSTLAAGTSTPTPVVSVELAPRQTGYLPAAKLDRTPKPPRAISWETFATSDPIADLDTAQMGTASLVAWVTHFSEEGAALDAKGSPKKAATVSVLAIDEEGAPRSEPNVISVRGASVGGVSLSARDDEALLAWVGHDAGQTQVFATRIDKNGKRLAQQMITRAKGGVSDVAVARADDGWILAWVDRRDGNGEVYVTKLDRSLSRTLPERRITKAPGDASQVRILAHEGEVWLGWMDVRDGANSSDPYAIRLNAKDLTPKGNEVRLAASAMRSHGLQLGSTSDGILAGWIDEAEDASSAAVRLLRLDANGIPQGMPMTVPFDTPPTSLALTCQAHRCRGVTTSNTPSGGLRVDAFVWGGASASPARLFAQDGSSAAAVAPALTSDGAIIASDDWNGQGRLRWARIVWE